MFIRVKKLFTASEMIRSPGKWYFRRLPGSTFSLSDHACVFQNIDRVERWALEQGSDILSNDRWDK